VKKRPNIPCFTTGSVLYWMPDGMFGFVRPDIGLCTKDDNPAFWYWTYASVEAVMDWCLRGEPTPPFTRRAIGGMC
jgi:hypothetical protein